jgi:eukaryotic-like serine/threonine-protein kinase
MSRNTVPLIPGARLGPYEIISPLGAGGMGEVYEPRWRGDGKEIFFFDPDNRLQAAPVSTDGPNFQSGSPVPLFQSRAMGYGFRSRWRYDVTRDGQRFLVNTPLRDESLSPLTLRLNWPELLEKP